MKETTQPEKLKFEAFYIHVVEVSTSHYTSNSLILSLPSKP